MFFFSLIKWASGSVITDPVACILGFCPMLIWILQTLFPLLILLKFVIFSMVYVCVSYLNVYASYLAYE